jgi:hypothetical protein
MNGEKAIILPSKLWVAGSSPAGRAKSQWFTGCPFIYRAWHAIALRQAFSFPDVRCRSVYLLSRRI